MSRASARVCTPCNTSSAHLPAAADREQSLLDALAADRFLILPHPEVAEFARRRVTDPDRWIAGMRRLRAKLQAGA